MRQRASADAPAPRSRWQDEAQLIARLGEVREKLLKEVRRVIVGQDEVLEQLLIAMFCRAHTLVVGVPGLAKTLIVRTLARTMNLDFKRIQFTPDLMPSDITGTEILQIDPETQHREFKFIPGPIFTNILLADEINRTPPKTQAALLECMQEYRVTSARRTYTIKPPFFVLATQNPIEQEGTYPLPEAQLDRFMLNIIIQYPSREEEIEIIRRTTTEETAEARLVMDARGDPAGAADRAARAGERPRAGVRGRPGARRRGRTRENTFQFIQDWVEWGAGPRAAQYLVLGAKARAVIAGRFNVSCADVRAVALPVLRHRIITNFNADSQGVSVDDVVAKLLQSIPEPTEASYAKKARRPEKETIDDGRTGLDRRLRLADASVGVVHRLVVHRLRDSSRTLCPKAFIAPITIPPGWPSSAISNSSPGPWSRGTSAGCTAARSRGSAPSSPSTANTCPATT